MQQNINQQQFTSLWGDYTINVQLVQDTLTIKLIDNKTGRKYSCGYTMENLPDRIKNNYETIEDFLFDLKFVLQGNNHERFKIKNNGEIIFGMEKNVAGQKRIIEQSLRTEEQVIQVDHQQLVKYIQNFDVEKHQKTKQIEELTIKIQSLKNQLNHKHLSQINQIQELKRRITYLQTSQVQINALSNQQLIQKIKALEDGAVYLNNQLEKCIKKSSIRNQNQMNIMEQNRLMEEEQVTDMGGQEAFIDGFYLTFTLKNHCLNIIVSEKATADEYIVNINQQNLLQYPIESPEMMFRQVTYIIRNQSQKNRISVRTNIKNAKKTQVQFSIKVYSLVQKIQRQVVAKFYGEKIEMNQMEKLTKIIQLTKKELSQVSCIAHDLSQNTAKEIKKWVLGQIKIHQEKQENYFCKLVNQTNKDLIKMKNRLLGIQETQGVRDDNRRVNNLNMDSLQKQLFRQNKEFVDFVKSNAKQLKQLELWTQTLRKKTFTLGNYRTHLRISNILETQNDYIKLFNLIPKKSKQLRLLYKASDYNFLAQQFHKKCDNIKHTVTLIKTQYNMVIGGYTPLMWDKNKNGQYQNDATGETIIFSLTNGDKFTDNKNGTSIYHYSNHGPRFGTGADIYISNQCNINQSSAASICNNFKNANYSANDYNSFKKFSGGTNTCYFRVLQYQLFEVIFDS